MITELSGYTPGPRGMARSEGAVLIGKNGKALEAVAEPRGRVSLLSAGQDDTQWVEAVMNHARTVGAIKVLFDAGRTTQRIVEVN